MIVRAELMALRSDDTPQRQAQSALRDLRDKWVVEGPGRQLEMELARLGQARELDDLPLLAALFDPADGTAEALIGALVATFVRQLATQPLSQAPLRYSSDDAVASLVVARHGDSVLVVQAIDGVRLAASVPPTSISFPPAETWERVLAGQGQAQLVQVAAARPGGAELASCDVTLSAGMVSHRIGQREAQLVRAVTGIMVVLKLQRRSSNGGVTRELRLADGALVHQSAGTSRDSRLELTTALLGRMGRSDAAPLLAAMAEEDGSQSLRWQALRECLALDSAAGFATLSQIARRNGDPLAGPADALRAQLLESHPQLAGVAPCPA